MKDFDYRQYSLSKLEEWMHDAVSCSEASPQEIYDTIKNVVDENYQCYKNQTERCYELLALLNGNGTGHISAYDDCFLNQDSSYNYPDSNGVYFCAGDEPAPYCKGSWNDFWDENNHSENSEEHSKYYYEYDRNDLYRENPFVDKVVKWQLPVEEDDASEEYYVNLPDDLLEAANLKGGDVVEWIDNNDGTYTLKKVENPTDKNTKN